MNLQKGLVGHWTMDDVDADNNLLKCRSGYNNTAEINNGVSLGYESPIGESFKFSRSENTNLSINYDENFYNNSISFSFWMKFGVSDDFNTFIDTRTPGSWDDGYYFRHPGTSRGLTVGTGLGNTNISASGVVNNDVWHYIVFTINNEDGSLYVDCVNEGNETIGKIVDSGRIIRIGERSDVNGESFNGNISDLRIYNRLLSEEEMNRLYNQRFSGSQYI